MDRVADRLGLSVPGLYHHVRGRDDLLRLAAERTMSRIEAPEYDGEHWSDWLIRCPSTRASTSVGPPAANGTTIVIWRVGYGCAWAEAP